MDTPKTFDPERAKQALDGFRKNAETVKVYEPDYEPSDKGDMYVVYTRDKLDNGDAKKIAKHLLADKGIKIEDNMIFNGSSKNIKDNRALSKVVEACIPGNKVAVVINAIVDTNIINIEKIEDITPYVPHDVASFFYDYSKKVKPLNPLSPVDMDHPAFQPESEEQNSDPEQEAQKEMAKITESPKASKSESTRDLVIS